MNLSPIEWRKSTWSTGNGGQCVEVAVLRDQVMVRDSKDPSGPVLAVTSDQWRSFITTLR